MLAALGMAACGDPAPPPAGAANSPVPPSAAPTTAPRPEPPYRKIADIEYARPAGRPLALDLYLPRAGAGPFPLVVWIHGGGWRSVSKSFTIASRLAGRGYSVASIDYRLSQVARFPAQLDDARAAVRFLRANAARWGIDAERVGAWGTSSGAHLAALLGTADEDAAKEAPRSAGAPAARVDAVCDYYGPADLVRLTTDGDDRAFLDLRGMITELMGGPLDSTREAARAASPIAHVSPDDAPFLIVHGDRDGVVPLHQSVALHEALRGAGVESELRIVPGAGHDARQYDTREIRELVDRFFDRHLRPDSAMGGSSPGAAPLPLPPG